MIKRFFGYFLTGIFLTIILTDASRAVADDKKALKFLDRKEFDKVIEVLDKDLEKDSLNPGSYYIYALLYDDLLYEKSNLDTAYAFVLIADTLIKNLDAKEILKLRRSGIAEKDIEGLKQGLEKRAFQRAVSANSVESINDFLNRFNTSNLIDEAISNLHSLAYSETTARNTYQAYYKFMNTYPDARQFENAKNQYDKLLYEDQTKENSLQSFEDFIIKFPNSPYINDAIEIIYKVRTCDNTEKSILAFIKDFPNSGLVNESIGRLYFNYISSGKKDFTYTYNFLELSDSIKHIDQFSNNFLIPVFEDGKYGFMTDEGFTIINNRFDGIELDYLCGNIRGNILVVEENGKTQLFSKNGEPVYTGDFYNMEPLGYGLIKISYNGKYGLISAYGTEIFDFKYEDIALVDSQLIKVKKDNEWYLFSLTGYPITDESYEEIEREGDFLFLKKNEKWAVTNNETLFLQFFEKGVSVNFIYDDYELVEETQVLCFRDDEESILNKKLKPFLPFENQNIYPLPEGWLIKRDSTYHIYDDAFVKISGSGFREVEYKGNWISGKLNGKWILYNNYAPFPDKFAYDSINILSDQFVLVYDGQESGIVFNNLMKETLPEYDDLHILQSSSSDPETGNKSGFLLLDLPKKYRIVYNNYGKKVLKGEYEKIQSLGPHYVKYNSKGKTGLIDSAGKVLIKPKYEGIANYSNGSVSLMEDQKFGLFNKSLGIHLEPRYNRIIKSYNKRALIASNEEGLGLIDHKGEEVSPLISKEIIYWNDTSMLAKEDGYWQIIDINSGEYLVSDIYDFRFMKNKEEKIILYSKDGFYGVLSNMRGKVINCSFNDIINLGNETTHVYFTEKFIPEAGFYIVIYYNAEGKILRKQVFDESEYDKIYCN